MDIDPGLRHAHGPQNLKRNAMIDGHGRTQLSRSYRQNYILFEDLNIHVIIQNNTEEIGCDVISHSSYWADGLT